MIVGPQKALACFEVSLSDVNWISKPPKDESRVYARLRNTASAKPARVFHDNRLSSVVRIRLDDAQFGIATGQAAAIYDGSTPGQLLGGGWITEAPLAALSPTVQLK